MTEVGHIRVGIAIGTPEYVRMEWKKTWISASLPFSERILVRPLVFAVQSGSRVCSHRIQCCDKSWQGCVMSVYQGGLL